MLRLKLLYSAFFLCLFLLVNLSVAEKYPQHWSALDETTGTISTLQVTLQEDTVGLSTNYTFSFLLNDQLLPPKARFEILFQAGFDISSIDSIRYSDSDFGNDDYSISTFEVSGNFLTITLADSGSAPAEENDIYLEVYGIGNAELEDSYQVAMVIFDSTDNIIALPAWSANYYLHAGELANFELFPKGVTQATAGTIVHYWVETSDQFGNNIEVDPIEWEVIGNPVVTGIIIAGDFQAKFTGASRVAASYETFADTSLPIFVLPGEFAYLTMEGGGTYAVAGDPWNDGTNDILVTAYDLFGNITDEFQETIYFVCSDPLAELPADSINPYEFTFDDAGQHLFVGSDITFFKAGIQTLELYCDEILHQVFSSISVVAANPDNFTLDIPDTVIAGEQFDITVNTARDNWGNRINADAVVELVNSAGISPSGSTPSLSDFYISQGSGAVNGKLVKAAKETIKVSINAVSHQQDIVVLPASLVEFYFPIDLKQVSEQTFNGLATLTALDQYANIITDYNASVDPVTITSSGTGSVLNALINSASAFVDGICDLTTLGIGYSGNELTVTFTATSSSGKIGISNSVEFSNVGITEGRLDQDSRYPGEQYQFTLTITNYGSYQLVVDQITIFGNDQPLSLTLLDNSLPDAVMGLSGKNCIFSGIVPNLPGQSFELSASFSGSIDNAPVSNSVSQLTTMTILSPEGVSVVAASFAPEQISIDREYQYSLTLRNDSPDNLTLSTDSKLMLGTIVDIPLTSSTVIEKNGGTGELLFDVTKINGISAQQITEVNLNLKGQLGTLIYEQTILIDASINAQTIPQLSYRNNSITPTTIYRGDNVEFNIDLENSGTANLSVNLDKSEIVLYALNRKLSAGLHQSHTNIIPGINNLDYKSIFIPSDFPTELDSIIIHLEGTSNNHSEIAHLNLNGDLVTIPSGGAVQVVLTQNRALNAPKVNVGQQFEIEATIRNQGDEDLTDLAVQLQSNGRSQFTADYTIALLAVDADTTISFQVTADLEARVSELFNVSVLSARGLSSDLPANILAPQASTQSVVIQTPANLSLSAFISSPSEAQDGIIQPTKTFEISAEVENLGESAASSGELTLILSDNDFILLEPALKFFTIDAPVYWSIQAPNDADTCDFEISITTLPLDANSGNGTKVITGASNITMIVSEVLVEISVDFSANAPTILTGGESYEVIEFDFAVLSNEVEPYLTEIAFNIKNSDGESLNPAEIIFKAEFLYNDQHTIIGLFAENQISFPLLESYGEPLNGVVKITIIDNPKINSFVLYIDSSSFDAQYNTDTGIELVTVKALFASQLLIEEEFTLVSALAEESFFCYPNPFSPKRGVLKFNVSNDGNAGKLTIYTLTGDEVIRIEIDALHSPDDPIEWNGRSSDGNLALNGIYLAVLSIDGKQEVRTKIAVVK